MGTWSFLGVKSGRGVILTPHSLLVPWSRKSRAIPLLPLWAVRPVQSLSACTRVHFTLPLPHKTNFSKQVENDARIFRVTLQYQILWRTLRLLWHCYTRRNWQTDADPSRPFIGMRTCLEIAISPSLYGIGQDAVCVKGAEMLDFCRNLNGLLSNAIMLLLYHVNPYPANVENRVSS